MAAILQSAFGLFVLIAICHLFSANRQAIQFPLILKSLLLQFGLALLLLKVPATQHVFVTLNLGISALVQATEAGTSFVFGFLGGGPAPYDEVNPENSFVLAFRVLPLIMVVSVLSGLLLYWRILPLIMRGITGVLKRVLGIGGSVGLAISANAFLGMVESPMLIRPYLAKMGRGEIFAVMTAGMATIAGTMLALEASIIADVVPNAVGHLISASLITLPAVVYISHLLEPHVGKVSGDDTDIEIDGSSTVDVIARSTQSGLQVFLSVIAMLIVIVALVHLSNSTLGLLPDVFGEPITVQRVLGYVMAPFAWLLGIPFGEALQAGQLLGVKTVLTEVIAYIQLGDLPAGVLSERSTIIVAYALCGFANFISLGIMITGLAVIAPTRREEILSLGMKSMVAGTIATATTACIVGTLL